MPLFAGIQSIEQVGIDICTSYGRHSGFVMESRISGDQEFAEAIQQLYSVRSALERSLSLAE
jgi:hypothetical protein